MKPMPIPFVRPSLVVCSGLMLALPAFAQRSVVIPARSSSTLDQNEGVVVTPPPAPVAPLSSPLSDKAGFSKVAVPSSVPGQGMVQTQSTPIADPAPNTNVTAVQRVETPPPPLDVATIKRLAELRRELRVAESAARARINLPADDLFLRDVAPAIDPLAEPVLREVVEYLERTLKKKVTVQSLYEPGEAGAKDLAWARVLALIDWLKANSSLDPTLLTATAPAPLSQAAPKTYALNIGESEYVNRIELHLE